MAQAVLGSDVSEPASRHRFARPASGPTAPAIPGHADRHSRALWRIDGRTFRVHVRGLAWWLCRESRPRDARLISGPGRMSPRPIEEAEAARAGRRDQPSGYLLPSPV